MTLTGSTTILSAQKSQTFTVDGTLFEYKPSQAALENFMIGAFIGEEYSFNKSWAWQFGLAYYQSVSSSMKGEETQAPVANPGAINFWDYQYRILSRQVFFENKLLFSIRKNNRPYLHPYVLAGLGESFNNTFGFEASSKNSGEVATAIYGAHKNASFIYELGVGLDMDVFKNTRLGVGYRFADLGKHDLGAGTLDTGVGGGVFSIPALKSTESFNHEIFVQLTYFI